MKEKITAELNKISNMSKEQKWDYFKTYYLAKTILIIIGIIMFAWFVKDTFLQKKVANAGCVYGVEISDEERKALTDGYLEYLNLNKKKYGAYISTDDMFEGTEQQMDANGHEMALLAQIAAGEIYYLILDKGKLEMLANSGVYASLDELFPNGVPSAYEEGIVKLMDNETGNEYPAAIDLKKAGIINDDREGYLVFTVGIPDKNYPEKFLNYLISTR